MTTTTLTVAQPETEGVNALVGLVEKGGDVLIARGDRPVAMVTSPQELAGLRRTREALREASLIMTRCAADSGFRTDLDEALNAFGLDRVDLEAEELGEQSGQ